MMLPLVVVTLAVVSTAAFSTGGGGHTSSSPSRSPAAKNDAGDGVASTNSNSLTCFATLSSSLSLSLYKKQVATPTMITLLSADEDEGRQVVISYIESLNSNNTMDDPRNSVRTYFTTNVEYMDASSFYTSIVGTEALIRHYYLHAGSTNLLPLSSSRIIIDDIVVASTTTTTATVTVCFKYHLATIVDEIDIPDTIGIAFCSLQRDNNDSDDNKYRISHLFHVAEPSSKPGNSGLLLLRFVSKFINNNAPTDITTSTTTTMSTTTTTTTTATKNTIVEQYFEAWNARNMTYAASLFTTNCIMYDLQYNTPFTGREAFTSHLLNVNECLPNSFNFVVDDIVQVSSNNVGVRWHVENGITPLQFTRGCSFYMLDATSGLIHCGYEIPEKAPPKLGYIQTIVSKFVLEPIRIVPAIVWVGYMYILFISDGILPGANALSLEQRTWEEVRDLSINFWLISPILHLPFSPIVHPMLEGVFNLLLAWAAMFAGFLSDERSTKPNLLPLGPMLLGMQFLTSGFLLPYLFTRTSEMTTTYTPTPSLKVYQEDITGILQSKIAESKLLGLVLGSVGSSSIVWGLFARQSDFGTISERYTSFLDLLSIDRVGSSFIVDLVIFAIFQSWFIDDDLRRRGVNLDKATSSTSELSLLRYSAKFVPFFGLVTYLTFRPPLENREMKD